MDASRWRWVPAGVLLFGAALTVGGARAQRALDLRAPLSSVVPTEIDGLHGKDVVISAEEQRVAGMDDYVVRNYVGGALAGASIYVGYYRQQTQGKSIHSPKNCLPGAGWEPLTSRMAVIPVGSREVPVNRYLLQKGKQRALVLYWYQGRGRVAANEYRVKLDLLRDQALRGRSDEALVRVIVPVADGDEAAAFERASRIAQELVPAVTRALPA